MPIQRIESGVAPAKSRLITHELNDTTDVGSMSMLSQIFTPPVGKIWEIIGMYLVATAPPGAASGTHQFQVVTGNVILITGKSVFGSSTKWDHSHWEIADSAKLPAESETTLLALLNAVFSHDDPLKIIYSNNTNVVASATRTIRLYLKETPST